MANTTTTDDKTKADRLTHALDRSLNLTPRATAQRMLSLLAHLAAARADIDALLSEGPWSAGEMAEDLQGLRYPIAHIGGLLEAELPADVSQAVGLAAGDAFAQWRDLVDRGEPVPPELARRVRAEGERLGPD